MADTVYGKTGLVPDAYFSASKIRWILDTVPEAAEKTRRGELLFGTVDTWLIWNLTGGAVHVTDRTNASRTMLYNIFEDRWDEELLRYFDIPESMLPSVVPSSRVYGATEPSYFGGRIPIAGAAGDQQAALFGQRCFGAGEIKNTYGTGCFTLMHTGTAPVRSRHGLLTTAAASADGTPLYALEGSVFSGGATVQWLRDEMGLLATAAESEKRCLAVPDTGEVYIVPAFAGLGAPYWNSRARGTITGLTRGTTRDHFVRAGVESMAYQVYDLIATMEKDTGERVRELKVDGGASANNFLLRFQSELLAVDIVRPECVETTALGAAYLAGLATGFWRDRDELSRHAGTGTRFSDRVGEEERERRLSGWHRAVRAATDWAEDGQPG